MQLQRTVGKKKLKKRLTQKRFFLLGTTKDRDYFLENFSVLLASGMPILQVLQSMQTEVRSHRIRRIMKGMIEDVQSGVSLANTFDQSRMFSPHVISLVRIGERSGRLVENLKIIAVEERKERSLRSKIRSATLYPLFVFGITIVVATLIAWNVLPRLASVFTQLKLQLPFVTKILIDGGLYLSSHGNVLIPGFLATILVLFYFTFFFSKTRIVGEIMLLLIPGVKRLLKETELARFGYLLGTLLEAGLLPTEALQSLSEASGLSRYRKFYLFLNHAVGEGNSFKKSFSLYRRTNTLFPVPVQQLIIAGEQSGTLSETLVRIGQTYEEKSDTTAKDLTIILEPILLVFVWLGVVGVALAVILPIYSLIGSLNM